ncbi:tubby-related protein 4-like [Centruroides sculpturatus]|uniref:tubby-related protein 4-like n=1 Tax=Centruroides sculpturatus TaxID=218467 RepID=UPI000C6D0643|nr:tubby-related protein 4-like [Centruroides sculpturatus]
MHLHFERTFTARTDCTILSLTWMGKIPEEIPDDEEWRASPYNYYQDGWLGTGNARGIVGITFTTCDCRKNTEVPSRANFNLRGHHSKVIMVRWNEPYQKLASCDSTGVIFVWIRYEGRWSIELINDRNIEVTDFSWSHDGRMALVCYQDGFILVGSVAGQRYWSSRLNIDAVITCGIWSPDDQQVQFGTTKGHILVIDVHGVVIAQVSVQENVSITAMSWSGEKFRMEDNDLEQKGDTVHLQEIQSSVLAVCFKNGTIYLMKTYDDISPAVIITGLKDIKMEWSNSGEFLAVAGLAENSSGEEYVNRIHFYTESGVLCFVVPVPHSQDPVTAITWGHNDRRLFIATGCIIHVGWVTPKIASLQLLARLTIYHCLRDESSVQKLPFPRCLRILVSHLFSQTIRCHLPDPLSLRDFVSRPPPNDIRLHCTMIRHDDEVTAGSATYTLFLEYLGGLVPLLKGKRASKLRPAFVIFDPQLSEREGKQHGQKFTPHQSSASINSSQFVGCSPPARIPAYLPLSSSESEFEDGCASPRIQRRRKHRHQNYPKQFENGSFEGRDLFFIDELPEQEKIVAVHSNIWGTKFKLQGIVSWLPSILGTVTYRTSVLHLQPRQMTLVIKELQGPQPSGNNQDSQGIVFSEDEDDVFDPELTCYQSVPIAPMTPKKQPRIGLPSYHYFYQRNNLSSDDDDRETGDYVDFIPSEELLTFQTLQDRGVHLITLQPSKTAIETSVVVQNSVVNSINVHPSSAYHNHYTYSPHFLNYSLTESNVHADKSNDKEKPIRTEITKCSEENPNSVPTHWNTNLLEADSNNFLSVSNNFLAVSSPGSTSDSSGSSSISGADWNKHSKGSQKVSVSQAEVPSEIDIPVTVNSTVLPSPKKTQSHYESSHSPIPKWEMHTKVNQINHYEETGVQSCSQSMSSSVPRWAEKAGDIKYIDDDTDDTLIEKNLQQSLPTKLLGNHRNRNVRHLHNTDTTSVKDKNVFLRDKHHTSKLKTSDFNKSDHKLQAPQLASNSLDVDEHFYFCGRDETSSNSYNENTETKSNLLQNGSNDSINIPVIEAENVLNDTGVSEQSTNLRSANSSPETRKKQNGFSLSIPFRFKEHRASLPQAEDLLDSSRPLSPTSKSIPSSPVTKRKNQTQRRGLLYSPLLLRKVRRQHLVESSDEEGTSDDSRSEEFKDLESFQKAYIRKKLRKWRSRSTPEGSNNAPSYREFVLHNKAPLWNEVGQVYQLDFSGRVTQESAKNFQIEFHGRQVMQFGKIDTNVYTLDFQYPFSALQAFAVALANVTQRLK